MSMRELTLRYTAFAIIATLSNLAMQRLVLLLYVESYSLALAIFFGTGVGLVIKYLLDKRWIFYDLSTGMSLHTKKFGLYILMGLVTTVIFWGSETVFWFIWQTDMMRELGAVLGLSIGYITKYQLDRRFVFVANLTKQGAA